MMMATMYRACGIALALGLCFATGAPALQSEPSPGAHSRVRLISQHDAAVAGEPIRIGILFEMDPGWHVYWENPGESGEPPRFTWSLPGAYRAAAPEWPLPARFQIGGIVNYGYEHRLLLPVTLEPNGIPSRERSVDIGVRVSWLTCRADSCVPATTTLRLSIPYQAGEPKADSRWAPTFEAFHRELPPSVRGTITRTENARVTLAFPLGDDTGLDPKSLIVFTREQGVVDESAPVGATRRERTTDLTLATAATAPAAIERLSGFLVSRSGERDVAFAFVAGHDADSATGATMTTARAGSAGSVNLSIALVFAFLGGILLNLMPCVFPVLSLKVLGFVERAHGNPRVVRVHGWAFTAGVLVSFWLLAATLLALRAGGEQLGWGFQLQSPSFVALLVYLMLAMALSLAGIVEFGSSFSSIAGRAGTEDGLAGSFWTGALATVVATPCTAPFMGPALGFALTQPSAGAMAIFSALGIGMAAPYLALSYFPAALARLPRPGPWMATFRKIMALPLLATAIWLADVFARQTGQGGLAALSLGAVLLTVALWLWGRAAGGRVVLRRAAQATAVLALAVALGAARIPPAGDDAHATADGFWQPWSTAKVAALRSAGTPVFVNFTAAWCLTCKVNERAIFARQDIRDLFAEHGVAALEADWTNEDPEIQQTLESYGRDGIPLYVYYPSDPTASPAFLPQVPSYGDFESAFGGRPQTTSRR